MNGEEAKARVIGEFERVYDETLGRLLGLGPADLDRPAWQGEGPGWRVRDLVPHLARWNRIGAEAARLIAAGKEPAPEPDMRLRPFIGIAEDVDTVNDATFRAWRERSDADRFAELRSAHAAFMDALRALPAARVVKDDGTAFRYFWTPGAGHLQLHWEHIQAARATEGAIG